MGILSLHSTALLLALSALGSHAFAPLQQYQQPVVSAATGRLSTPRFAIAMPLPGEQAMEEEEEAKPPAIALEPEDAWVAKLDYKGFGEEVTALGRQLAKEGGQDDVKHLNKIVRWRDIAAVVGLSTMWMTPNPVTVLALSTWTYASWTMIAHHTCHGGYNRVDAGKYNSRGFALGSVGRRFLDWLDWMQPEAWNIEHNRLHHYRLNENSDPDLVQRNTQTLRDKKVPRAMKYVEVAILAMTWKWLYYAPNTYKELQVSKMAKEGTLPVDKEFDPADAATVFSLLGPKTPYRSALSKVIPTKDLFLKVLGPYFFFRFVALPLPLLAIPGVGPTLFKCAVANMAIAEVVTNLHAFITIVTNHAGEDLYTFQDAVKPKTSSFYVRQIVGSANYATGNDPVDFSHGWLNYQIEHHVWPDLSMLQYQKAAPKLKAICEKYGVPYVQESVWERLRKTVDIMVGKSTMRSFPTQFEPQYEKAVNGISWKNNHGAIDAEE